MPNCLWDVRSTAYTFASLLTNTGLRVRTALRWNDLSPAGGVQDHRRSLSVLTAAGRATAEPGSAVDHRVAGRSELGAENIEYL